MVNQLIYVVEGLVLGLTTGPICLASCGPVYATYLMQKNRNAVQSGMTLLQISAGRFFTYLIFGCVAGAMGTKIALLKRDWFTAIAYILFSIILVVSAHRTRKCEEGCRVTAWTRFTEIPFMLGMATGISFCPSFLLALTKAIDNGGVFAGALLFGAFFFGTTFYFIPIVLFGVIGKTYQLRMIARIASCIVAVWFIIHAIMLILQ